MDQNHTAKAELWIQKHTRSAAGNGLFARQKIRRGQPILREITGIQANPDTQDLLPPVYKSFSVESLVIADFDPTTFSLSQVIFGIGPGRQPLDNGRYPIVMGKSLVNHSCIPNMFMLNFWPETGLEVHFYAIREIRPGEQLTVCYRDSTQDLLQEEHVFTRRALLNDFFGFHCLCLRCVGQSTSRNWHCPEYWTDSWFRNFDIPGYQNLSEYQYALVEAWQRKSLKLRMRDKTRKAISKWKRNRENAIKRLKKRWKITRGWGHRVNGSISIVRSKDDITFIEPGTGIASTECLEFHSSGNGNETSAEVWFINLLLGISDAYAIT